MKSPFDLNHQPKIGVAEPVVEGLRVVTAPNASPMTFTGTRSYLLGEREIAMIDPGPDDPAHYDALKLALNGRKLSHIVVTHSHIDHSPLARRFAKEFDVPVYGFGASHAGRSPVMAALAKQGGLDGGEGIDHAFKPDIELSDAQKISGAGWEIEAIHTPGHLSNHLSFGWGDAIFSGDHIMGWSTTLVSPPDGDLSQFMASIKKLRKRPEQVYYPGHGAPIIAAHAMLDFQQAHRLNREAQVLQAIADGFSDIQKITSKIYAGVDQRLWPAASRNVFAHIIDLMGQGKVQPIGALHADGHFQLV